jgi:SAUR family protein
MKRFVIPVSYLLSQSEEQFRYDHPMGGITIPCREDVFLEITSSLN